MTTTYENYLRRPVYMTQCFTCAVYCSLGGPISALRLLPAYRTAASQSYRAATALMVRQMRQEGLDRREVRRQHENRLANPSGGIAVVRR